MLKIGFMQGTRRTHFGWDWFSEDCGNDKLKHVATARLLLLGLRPPDKVLISGGASWLTDQRVVETLCGPIPSAIFPLTKDFRVFRRVWRHSSPRAGCLRPGLSVFCAVGKRVSRCCRASRIY